MINARDLCHDTPRGVTVNIKGCTTWDVKERISFVNFFFGFDKDTLPDEGKQALANVASKINANDDYSVTVIGDTSPEGSLRYNAKLAGRRAQAVVNLLLSYGVPRKKIDVHFFTDDIPIVHDFMKQRQHRVVALIHSPDYQHVPQWNIFTSENALKK